MSFDIVFLYREDDEVVPLFDHNLSIPNCRELLGRKIRLLWKNEEAGKVYFRIKVHMEDTSQYAAVGIAAKG